MEMNQGQNIVKHISADVLDGVTAGMLENNTFSYLLQMKGRQQESYEFLLPDGHLETLADLGNEGLKKKTASLVLEGISGAVRECRDYLIEANQLQLDPAGIFINQEAEQICFLCVPQKFQQKMAGAAEELARWLTDRIDGLLEPDKQYLLEELPQLAEGKSTAADILERIPEGKACLLYSKTEEKIFLDKPEFIIGKSKIETDYCVTDNNTVSRKHASVISRGCSYYLVDHGSSNFTYVNGVKVDSNEQVPIFGGDEIRISNEVFSFFID